MKRVGSMLWKAGKILVGSGLLAFSVKCVYDPCGLVIGGFSGIAIMIKRLTVGLIPGGVPLGVSNLALNVPFFVMAWFLLGRAFVRRTLFATVALSLWLTLLPEWSVTGGDYLLTAIAGGVIGGLGIGLVLSVGTTTGGTDMVGSLLQKKLPYVSVSRLMVLVDGAIVLSGVGLFGVEAMIYAGCSLYLQGRVSEVVALGGRLAKTVFIITDKPAEVVRSVLRELERGITSFSVRGEYTGAERRMLLCVVDRKETFRLKEIVNRHDEGAFVIVSDVREVLGEGF